MKRLTKHEAIGRMMLAQAELIEKNVHCELTWYPSWEQFELKIFLKRDDKNPILDILRHPDFESNRTDLNGYGDCLSYSWTSLTVAP